MRAPAAVVSIVLLAGCAARSPDPAPPPAAATSALVVEVAPPPREEPPPPTGPLRARFLSVGDVIFGRHVQEILDAKGDPEHPFRPLAALYSEVDFTFANLENPFFSGAKPRGTPPGKTLPVLWAKPEHARTLARYRFFAVNLANNHAMDQGLAGLEETMTTLDAAGIRHVGAGRSLEEAWRPMIVDVRGLRIGFVGVSYTSQNDTSLRNEHVARIEDEDRLAAACKEAREREKAHFVVATMHAGVEHDHEPNAQQRVFARAAVRAGADIVIGAHPHVVQPAAKVEGTWVFYSLGNFVFDQPSLDNREAVAVELELVLPPGGARAKIERLRVHPVRIDEAAPRPAPEESAVRILRRLHVDSRDGVMPVE